MDIFAIQSRNTVHKRIGGVKSEKLIYSPVLTTMALSEDLVVCLMWSNKFKKEKKQ